MYKTYNFLRNFPHFQLASLLLHTSFPCNAKRQPFYFHPSFAPHSPLAIEQFPPYFPSPTFHLTAGSILLIHTTYSALQVYWYHRAASTTVSKRFSHTAHFLVHTDFPLRYTGVRAAALAVIPAHIRVRPLPKLVVVVVVLGALSRLHNSRGSAFPVADSFSRGLLVERCSSERVRREVLAFGHSVCGVRIL